MYRTLAVVLFALFGLVACGGGGSEDSSTNPASDLEITTATVAAAQVGVKYEQSLTGKGGEKPYAWRLASASGLEWLNIDSNGVLTGRPTVANPNGATLIVVLEDATGEQVQKEYLLTVMGCTPGEETTCSIAQNGACHIGTSVCARDGTMGDCIAEELSTEVASCGENCEPCVTDPGTASTDCVNGVCEIQCTAGHYDCDENKENGCEVPVSADNCGDCGQKCEQGLPNVASNTCDLTSGKCVLTCKSGYENRDDAVPGCEYGLSDINHCGARTTPCPDADGDGHAVCTNGVCGIVCDNGSTKCDNNLSCMKLPTVSKSPSAIPACDKNKIFYMKNSNNQRCGLLRSGGRLQSGEEIWSCNNLYRVRMDPTGQLQIKTSWKHPEGFGVCHGLSSTECYCWLDMRSSDDDLVMFCNKNSIITRPWRMMEY
jgi:hypothetical protein